MGMRITKETRKNLYTYLILLFITVLGSIYGHFLAETHANIRVWNLVNILIMLIGIPFVFYQSRAKFPNFWHKDISNYDRFVKPLFIGLIFGLLDVLIFKIVLHPAPYSELPPFLQPFPYSIFLYVSGAFEVEVFYRLIPMTLLMLLGAYFMKGKYLNYFFWIGAILTSLREPLEQLSDNLPWVMIYALLSGFLMNFLQVLFYRKSGFLSSLTIRLGHYLLWHILLGMYVEYLEVA